MMDPALFRVLDNLMDQALDLPEGERRSFLEAETKGDDDLLQQALTVLEGCQEERADWMAGGALQGPTWESLVEELRSSEGLPADTRVGEYRILDELGRGGMSVVYRAERADDAFEQTVAIKVLKAGLDTEEVLRRFHQERQILAGLKHPNIAGLLDGGSTEQGRPYLVMELVEGSPIDHYCDDHEFNLRSRLMLFKIVAAAVQFAHRNLVIHRDIKPSNILVDRGGRVTLLDFGIAKLMGTDTVNLTRIPSKVMTPEYAAPEQVRGDSVSTSTDVYLLGLLLYQLLTGHRAHNLTSSSPTEMEKIVCDGRVVRPSERVFRNPEVNGSEETLESLAKARQTSPERLRTALCGDLDQIILKAIRKEPDQRYGSVDQLIEDIDAYLESRPVSARRGNRLYLTRKFLTRHRVAAMSLSIVLLILGGITLGFTWRLAQERNVARLEAEKANRVKSFLEDLLRGVDPDESQGEDLTVSTLFGQAAERIKTDLGDQSEIRAELMDVIGSGFIELGQYTEALSQIEGAVALRRQYLGDQSPALAESLYHLGRVHFHLAQYDESAAALDEAIAIQERGGLVRALVESLNGRANLLNAQNRILESTEMHLKAAALYEDFNEKDEAWLIPIYHNVGTRYIDLGELEKAEEYLTKALVLKRRHGFPTLSMAQSYHSLGFLHYRKGELGQAEEMFHQSYSLLEGILEPNHPNLVFPLEGLSAVLQDQKQYDQSREIILRTRDILEKSLGAEHPRTAMAYNNLAGVLMLQGHYEEALPWAEKSLSNQIKTRGEKHPDTVSALLNLAIIQGHLQSDEQAVDRLRDAVQKFEKSHGVEEARCAFAHYQLGLVLQIAASHEEAKREFLKALTLLENNPASLEHDLVTVREALGAHDVSKS